MVSPPNTRIILSPASLYHSPDTHIRPPPIPLPSRSSSLQHLVPSPQGDPFLSTSSPCREAHGVPEAQRSDVQVPQGQREARPSPPQPHPPSPPHPPALAESRFPTGSPAAPWTPQKLQPQVRTPQAGREGAVREPQGSSLSLPRQQPSESEDEDDDYDDVDM